MPSQHRPRRLAAALVLAAGLALSGCSAAEDTSAEDAALQAREQADALRAELSAFVLPGGEQSLEPSALSGVDAGAGYHAETLFTGRGADGEALIGEAESTLEAAGLTRVTDLPDGSQVPADPGALSTGYWAGGDWVVGAQAGVRLGDDAAQSGDLVLQYVFLAADGGGSGAEASDASAEG